VLRLELFIFIYQDYKQTVLKGEIIIYRGYHIKSTPLEKAHAWTTELSVAEFFANRLEDVGYVAMAKVNAEDILDYFNDRDEHTVLVLPKNVEIISKDIGYMKNKCAYEARGNRMYPLCFFFRYLQIEFPY
jgi:hypothetical protein